MTATFLRGRAREALFAAAASLSLSAAPLAAAADEAPPQHRTGASATRSGAHPDIRSGRLANGFNYAIARGAPGEKIVVMLAVRGGDFDVEGRGQQVAHVVEHVVTDRLSGVGAGGGLSDFIGRLGGVYGSDANAGAGVSDTFYFVRVAVDDEVALGEALGALADWASPETLSDEDIDRGRKTVIEEGRANAPDSERVFAAKRAAWFPAGSRFAAPLDPIGTLSATPAAVRAFHARYFVPANMMAIVVGDVDPAAVIAALDTGIGRLPAAARPDRAHFAKVSGRAGHYLPVRTTGGEAAIEFSYKYRAAPRGSIARARQLAVGLLAERLFADALANWARDPAGAVRGGGVSARLQHSLTDLSGVDILLVRAAVAGGRFPEGLRSVAELVASARDKGFGTADIENARAALLAEQRGRSISNREIAGTLRERFIFGAAEPGSADIAAALEALAPRDVNAALRQWLSPAARDIFLIAPDAHARKIPDAREGLRIVGAARPVARLTPPEHRRPVFAVLPPAPRALPPLVMTGDVASATLPRSGATFLYRQAPGDDVTLQVVRRGGSAMLGDRGDLAGAVDLVSASGLGGVDGFDLAHFWQAETMRIAPVLRPDRRGLEGRAPANRFPLLLSAARSMLLEAMCPDRLLAARRAAARDPAPDGDAEYAARQAFVAMLEAVVEGRPAKPERDDATGADLCDLFRREIADLRGATIAGEGPMPAPEALALVAAALDTPGSGPEPTTLYAVRGAYETRGERHILRRGADESASILLFAQRAVPSADRSETIAAIAGEIVRARLFKRLRGVEMGIYRIAVGAARLHDPERTSLSVEFECLDANAERLANAAIEEMKRLGDTGASAAEIAIARDIVARPDTVGDVAERWIFHATLAAPPVPDDASVNRWLADHLGSGRFDLFARTPDGSTQFTDEPR